MRGVVKWFNSGKGFGFITPEGSKKDLFVHYTGIKETGKQRRTLTEGAKVTFDIIKGKQGDQAENVVEL